MIKVLSLFDGISAGRLALERAGIQVSSYYKAEIDKFANKVSETHYMYDLNFGDVSNWREWDIDWSSIDLLIGGSPCFVAGTNILTETGYKNIEDIKTGDFVLTHTNNWEKVLTVGGKIADTFELKAQGMLPTQTTFEHPYLVKTMSRKWNNEKRTSERVFSDSEWKKAGELKKGDFIAIPKIKDSENTLNLSDEDCFIIGRYIADGHTRQDTRESEGRLNSRYWQLILSVGSHKIPKITINHSLYKHTKSVHRLVISSKRLVEIVESECGNTAINKKISTKLLKLPNDKLEILINGLLSGDGSKRGNEYRLTTVSKELAQSLCLAITKVYSVCASIEFTKRPEKTIIDGRLVNQKDTYTVSFRKEIKKQSKFYVDDDYVWSPVKSMHKTGKTKSVYNLEVENDNTYIANNIVVHNCQGFSFAGKQLAFDDPRSSLFFVYVEILNHIKSLNPNVKFLLENVKMKKEYLDIISSYLGVEPLFINSAVVSAQNRQRFYWCNWEVTPLPDNDVRVEYIIEDMPEGASEVRCGAYRGRYLVNGVRQDGKMLTAGLTTQRLEVRKDFKTNCLTTVQKDNVLVFSHANNIISTRYLTVTECARLQGFPDDWCNVISKSQTLKAYGNSWTIDVIAHLFKNMIEK